MQGQGPSWNRPAHSPRRRRVAVARSGEINRGRETQEFFLVFWFEVCNGFGLQTMTCVFINLLDTQGLRARVDWAV